MTIYRSIALEEGTEINWQNVGASFTMCPFVARNLAEERFSDAARIVVISADFSDSEIDWDYTCGQMISDYFDAELEAVVNDQIEKTFTVVFDSLDEMEGEEFEGSTGYSDRDETMSEYCEEEEEKTLSDMIEEWKRVLSEVQ